MFHKSKKKMEKRWSPPLMHMRDPAYGTGKMTREKGDPRG